MTENDTPVGEFWISEGTLPAGLELIKVEDEQDTARISGIPEESGTNVSGQTGAQEYSIVVEE